MELYRDEFVFRKEEKIESKKNKYVGLKIAILTLALTFGPSIGRGIVHSIQKSDKELELSERDEMYNTIIEKMKELDINNSIVAIKFISNLINDGYLTIDNTVNAYYNMVDEYDYNTIIGSSNPKSDSEVIAKIINGLYDDIDAFTINVNLASSFDEENTKYVDETMCFICDRRLKVNYLYSSAYQKFAEVPNLSDFQNKYFKGSASQLKEYIEGNFDIKDLITINSNDNNTGSKVNFDKYVNYADALYESEYIKVYELNKLITRNKVAIETSELKKVMNNE